jgi:putative MFS transporter
MNAENPAAQDTPLLPWHLRARIIVGVATFFDAFDALAIAYVLPLLIKQWHLSSTQIGLTISLGYAGQFMGALCAGWLADRYGRLRVLMLTVAVLSLCSFLMAFSWSWTSLLVIRVVQGIGLGGEVPVAASYITEIARAKDRGRFVLLYELIFPIGVMVVALTGYWIVPRWGWRWLFVIGGLSALLCLYMRRALPESPRWVKNSGSSETQPKEHPVHPRELFAGHYKARTLMVWVLWFTTYLAFYGLWTWLPSLYTSVYHLPLQLSLRNSLFMQTGGLLGAFLCAVLIDRLGRRLWISASLILGALPLFALWWLKAPNAHLLLLCSVSAAPFIASVASALYLYTPELYPTRIRALGSSVASAWLRLAAIIGPMIIGTVLLRSSIMWAFFIFAVTLTVGGIVTAFFADETRGQVLEQVSP